MKTITLDSVQYAISGEIWSVDFDGTIVDEKHGQFITESSLFKELPLAISTLKDLQKMGVRIIIFTCRGEENRSIIPMKQWLDQQQFIPDAINDNVPELDFTTSRKIYADKYLDNRSIPAFPGWHYIRQTYMSDYYRNKTEGYSYGR